MRTLPFFVVLTVFSLLMPRAFAAPPPESLPEAVAQVDGITSRVVDRLWLKTDVYWHHGDYNRVVSLLRVCVAVDPNFIDAYSNGAWLLWSMGDTDAAEAFIRDGVNRSSKKSEIYYEFGFLLYSYRKNYAAALPFLYAATRYPNAGPVAWSTLAHCYDRLNRTDESVAAWRELVKRFPEWAAGPPNLRRIEEKQRKLHSAPPADTKPT